MFYQRIHASVNHAPLLQLVFLNISLGVVQIALGAHKVGVEPHRLFKGEDGLGPPALAQVEFAEFVVGHIVGGA